MAYQWYFPLVLETYSKSNGNSVEENRNLRLSVRISESEKRKFEKMAKDSHTDLAVLTRQILHREADKAKGKG